MPIYYNVIIILCIAISDKLIYIDGIPYDDLIIDLPGEPGVGFRQFSGYLRASETTYLHYWYVESSRDPDHDPLVVWLNGGPGCSSLDGLLTENGPFNIADDGRELIENPHSWNKLANMLYIESPGGVGFSYKTINNYTFTDEMTADQNYAAMLDFYRKFPNLLEHDLYLTGESYAGVYIPMLATRITENKDINLMGFAIGNGITDTNMLSDSYVYYAASHGLIGQRLWNEISSTCCDEKYPFDACKFTEAASTLQSCKEMMEEVLRIQWFAGYNTYNLFAPCAGGVPRYAATNKGAKRVKSQDEEQQEAPHAIILDDGASEVYAGTSNVKEAEGRGRRKGKDENLHRQVLSELDDLIEETEGEVRKALLHPLLSLQQLHAQSNDIDFYKEVELAIPCTNSSAAISYLNNPDVRRALHIPEHVQKWTPCSTEVSLLYVKTRLVLREEYLSSLSEELRIMVYNGDADMACNFLGDQWFVNMLGQKELMSFRPWYVKEEIAGYFHSYENIDFVTIKGAGHMVPTDKPLESFEMFSVFLGEERFITSIH